MAIESNFNEDDLRDLREQCHHELDQLDTKINSGVATNEDYYWAGSMVGAIGLVDSLLNESTLAGRIS